MSSSDYSLGLGGLLHGMGSLLNLIVLFDISTLLMILIACQLNEKRRGENRGLPCSFKLPMTNSTTFYNHSISLNILSMTARNPAVSRRIF